MDRLRFEIKGLDSERLRLGRRPRRSRRDAVRMGLGALLAWMLLSAPPTVCPECEACPECVPRLTVIKTPLVSSAEHGAEIDLAYWIVGHGPEGYWIEPRGIDDEDCPGSLLDPDGDQNDDRRLSPGEVWRYRCTYTVAAHLDGEPNPLRLARARIPGNDQAGSELLGISNDPMLRIDHPPPPPPAPRPRLGLRKCLPHWALPGDELEFELRLTNEGNVPLRELRIADPDCPDLSLREGALAPGETWTYSCAFTPPPDRVDSVGRVRLAAAEASGWAEPGGTRASAGTGSPWLRQPETIDFEASIHGCYAPAEGGLRIPTRRGDAAVSFLAENPRIGRERNAAVVFDSDCRPRAVTGDCRGVPGSRHRPEETSDPDLCTPHEDFQDGLGQGAGGRRGSRWANDTSLGKLLIAVEDLDDSDGDDLVDVPNDEGDIAGTRMILDFSEILRSPETEAVSLLGFTLVDNDDPGLTIALEGFDGRREIACEPPQMGDNGVVELRFGTSETLPGPGVVACAEEPIRLVSGSVRLVLEGFRSKGLDNVHFAREGPRCF